MGDITSGSSRGANYLDVDAALLEQKFIADPIVVHLFGRDWSFPGVMPSLAMLRLARWNEAGIDLERLGITESMQLIGDLIPDAYLAEWGWQGVGISSPDTPGEMNPAMEMILTHLVTTYLMREAALAGGGERVGEAEAPETGRTGSSPTGSSSKPTAPESTGSISPATSEV